MPKYKSPDGKVFDNAYNALAYYCDIIKHCCNNCFIGKHIDNVSDEYMCNAWVAKHAEEAARLMGYEIIEDEKKEIEPDECEQNRGEVENCTDCIHNKVCALWCAKECQNAASFQTEGCDYFEPRQVCVAIGEQEAKADSGKPRPSLVQPALIRADMGVREYGCQKYHKPDNWRNVEASRYWDALLRHVLEAWDDWQAVDLESGLPHLHHIICNAGFLAQYMEDGNG